MKIPLLESLFNSLFFIAILQAHYFIKKRLQHRRLLVKSAKFLEHIFLQNNFGGCFCRFVLLFPYSLRWINSNLFEIIHLNKNLKTFHFSNEILKIISQYAQKNTASITLFKNSINLHDYSSVQSPLNILHQNIFLDNQNSGGRGSTPLC